MGSKNHCAYGLFQKLYNLSPLFTALVV